MKIISLTKGLVTVVDDEDFEALSVREWYAQFNGICHYAAAGVMLPDGSNQIILMHRIIVGASPDQIVDHKDRNTLDNRRSNLRFCTKAQNAQNSTIRKDNTSGRKGVSFRKELGKWRATIQLNKKSVHLGNFDDLEAAAMEYDLAAMKHFGPFARTNAMIHNH